jgi:hypothetical protein
VAASLGLTAQIAKLERIESRLERMAVAAEAGGSPNGVAVLSAQALRGIETGAKLAGLPGFAPIKTSEVAAGVPFSVTIQFSGGETVSISPARGAAAPPTIDADELGEAGTPAEPDPLSRLTRAFAAGSR